MATIAERLTQLQNAKENIKQAIENKGVSLSNVPFTQYHEKIAEISVGEELDLFLTAAKKYHEANLLSDLEAAWQKKVDSETILYDIPLTRIAQNQDIGIGIDVDIYTGDFTQLWADCNSHTLLYRYFDFCEDGPNMDECPPNWEDGSYIINDILGIFSNYDNSPIQPFYVFFNGVITEEVKGFLFADLGSGVVMCHPSHLGLVESFTLREGYKTYLNQPPNDKGLILSDLITEIGLSSYFTYGLGVNEKPLVLPPNLKKIADSNFTYNNNYEHLLEFPATIKAIGSQCFQGWAKLKDVRILATTPPEIDSYTFLKNCSPDLKIQVPASAVATYKNDPNWAHFGDKIVAIE